MKKNKWILLIISVLMVGCSSSYNYSVNSLKSETLSYSELPITIKDFLNDPGGYRDISPEGTNLGVKSLVSLDGDSLFSIKIIMIGPWVDYTKLIDLKKNIVYRIDQGVPFPYIISDNKLYIPNEYNILFSTTKNFEKYTFTCYELK